MPHALETTQSQVDSTPSETSESRIDHREQLFNEGKTGPIEEIQVSTERTTRLKGILYDIDPHLFRTSPIMPTIPTDPVEFYRCIVKPLLDRHSVLSRAEIRNSGRGLHAILWFSDPPEFETDQERNRWAGIVEVVQTALPIDPDQPGITAVTRPLGSINGKNGATITCIKPGEPLASDEVLKLYEELKQAPFRTVMRVLTGKEMVAPCPICAQTGSKLSALHHAGRCYGSCGNVKLHQLYDLVLAPRPTSNKGAADVSK